MTTKALLFVLLVWTTTLCRASDADDTGNVLRIANATDLINFSNEINNGISFEGTTVLLEADIDFSGELSEQFQPIG